MSGRILAFAYRMRYRPLGPWGLDRWAITVLLVVCGIGLLSWLLRGRPPVASGDRMLLAVLLLVAGVLIGLRAWGARRSYVAFAVEPELSPPSAQPLAPADKVSVRATGQFEVEGKTQFHANLLAYWRTFASREHAVMAIAHEERFLLLGTTPIEHVGMWYIFFRAEMVEAVTPGRLIFGSRKSPALCVGYRYAPPSSGRRKPPRPSRERIYLAFEDEPARQRVWADLLAG